MLNLIGWPNVSVTDIVKRGFNVDHLREIVSTLGQC